MAGTTSNSGGVVIVADDLTGACDSGAAFLRLGRAVRVVLDSKNPAGRSDPGAVRAFTTESRNLTEAQAAESVGRTVRAVARELSSSILFKKVDSAGRGHFGVETMAALDASGAVIALVAPAFPQSGRTVREGILHVRDAAGQDAKVSLSELFGGVDATRIGILPRGSEGELENGIVRAIERGVRVLLSDAETQGDLERLALAACGMAQKVLWTGSAGLAYALAANLPELSRTEAIQQPRREGRTLVFVGTDHSVTEMQVAYLEAEAGGKDRTIHRLEWGEISEEQIREAFGRALVGALVLTGGDTAAYVLRALGASSILLAGELSAGIPWGLVEGGVADGCVVITKSGGFGTREALVYATEFCNRRVYESA